MPGACTHIEHVTNVVHPKQHACEECVKTGSKWRASKHPVIASAEPGERWLYCYPDDALAEY